MLKGQRGQALIEMAFVLPVMVVMLFGILTFGIAVNTKIATTTAAREAARYYAIYKSVSGTKSMARQMLKEALPVSEEEFNRNFNEATDVAVSVSGGYVTVTVTYHQPTYVPGLLTVLGGSRLGDPSGRFVLSSKATFKVED